ncbi:MAG: hypothetical protein GF313_07140 [Caldithrix sp.]|nr:hypothetical protein [Caldithrix sp.]
MGNLHQWRKRRQLLVGALAVILLVILLSPWRIPQTINVIAKVWPHKEWFIINTANDGVQSKQLNHLQSLQQNVSHFIPERGDAFDFTFYHKTTGQQRINRGDTVAIIHSRLLQRHLNEQQALLKERQKELDVLLSGEKQALVAEARAEVQRARVHNEYQQNLFERHAELYKKDLISREQFQTVKNSYETSKAALAVARARLQNMQSGDKPAMIALKRAQIETLEKNVTSLQKQKNDMVLRAPFSGELYTSSYSDTLGRLEKTDPWIMMFPIELNAQASVQPGKTMRFKHPSQSGVFDAVILRNGLDVDRLDNKQVFLVTAKSAADTTLQLKPGVVISGKIKGQSLLLRDIFINFIKDIFR